MDAETIPALLRARTAATPDSVAYEELDEARGRRSLTWNEFNSRVTTLRGSLSALGIRPGDRVGILAPNSLEWEIAQHAALDCGALVAGIDPHYPQQQLDAVVRRLGLAALFAEDASSLSRIDQAELAALKLKAVFRGEARTDVVHVDELLRSSHPRRSHTEPDLIRGGIITFSSGTTGDPKPIAYTHAQACGAIQAIVSAFPQIEAGDRLLCWLPLANLFQRMLNFCALVVGATSYVLGDPRAVMPSLAIARPHIFIGVPRFFERVHAGVVDRLARAPWPVRKLSHWAIDCSHRAALAVGSGTRQGAGARLAAAAADRLVLRRIRRAFGGHARFLVSGSAPMPVWLLEWFDAVGLPVYEAYGVSEDITPIALNRPGQRRLGTVGKPLPPNRVKLAPDGEILVQGAGVFNGYLNEHPRMTSATPDDYWATGDLGSFDEDGFLSVHGRKSDNFKTSTGRWVSPARVEERLRRIPHVEHAVVLGAGRKAVAAILCLDPRYSEQPTSAVTDDNRSTGSAKAHSAAKENLIAALNEVLADLPAHERPAAVFLLRTGFSIAGGELTTNLKLRRAEVEKKYALELEKLYRALDARPSSESTPQPLVVEIA
jgi:long-chain acyl-CoA synthetase